MFLRNVILPTLFVGALATVAPAVTFAAETHMVLKFGALPTGVTLDADKSRNKDLEFLGNADAAGSINFGGNDVDRFTVDTQVAGEATDGGAAAALARGTWSFTLTNTTNSAVFIDLKLKLTQIALVRDYLPGDSAQAYSWVTSPGNGQTAGNSLFVADPTNDTNGDEYTTNFSIRVKKNDSLSFSFIARSVGTVQAVPEPSAFAAMGVGAVALMRRRRK